MTIFTQDTPKHSHTPSHTPPLQKHRINTPDLHTYTYFHKNMTIFTHDTPKHSHTLSHTPSLEKHTQTTSKT